jgi:PIN domain nuclease of toxin-antitoxin system
MDYLLDTHVLLWSIYENEKINPKIKAILADYNCKKFVSISSLWEIAIKNRIGKLPLPGGLPEVFTETETLGYGLVGIDQQHIEIYVKLPLLHRDPFDGIIIATALVENMTIITTDENIQKYDVPWIW